MTLDYGAWIGGNTSAIDEETRAAQAWRRIQRSSESITVKRAGVKQSAITVRIEHGNGANALRTENRVNVTGQVVVFGIRNHASLADTDIQAGDKFVWEQREYEVRTLTLVPGEIQALCEVME